MHSVLLYYKKYCIVCENYIYRLHINPTRHYLTMKDIMNEIDNLEKIQNNFSGIINRIGENRCNSSNASPNSSLNEEIC